MAVGRHGNALIVDDFDSMRDSPHKPRVQPDVKNVEPEKDGAEALKEIKSGDFGRGISDWNMEPMDGNRICKKTRAREKRKRLPFVMAAAETRWTKWSRAEEAGIEHYPTKPVATENPKLAGLRGRL